jgi:hypothetical protein
LRKNADAGALTFQVLETRYDGLAVPKAAVGSNPRIKGEVEMRKSLKALVVASALAAAVAVAPTLSAHETQNPQGPTMGHGMMGHGGMKGMMEHMSRMSQTSQMLETCNKFMQGAVEKRDQAPEAPPRQQK